MLWGISTSPHGRTICLPLATAPQTGAHSLRAGQARVTTRTADLHEELRRGEALDEGNVQPVHCAACIEGNWWVGETSSRLDSQMSSAKLMITELSTHR